MPKSKLDWSAKPYRYPLLNADSLRTEILSIIGSRESDTENLAVDVFASAACVATEIYLNAKYNPTEGEIKAGLKELASDINSLRRKLLGPLNRRIKIEIDAHAIKNDSQWTLKGLMSQLSTLELICNNVKLHKRRNRKVELCLQIMSQFAILLRQKPTIYANRAHGGKSSFARVLSACFKAADNGVEPSDLDRLMTQAKRLYPEYMDETKQLNPDLLKALEKELGF